ncbi:SH3 domain-containing protein [Algicella marina]|uniref:Aspartyl-trna synthetase n=1 Tax=Algicella marina TaxID=2683284 RepID=A0A6P1T6M3_9RHOB|nr:SH3 domain-containing protein [Algicella marina]QHQ37405.1 aspartyl-trna synthetase [Algicella marina]
MAAVAATFLAVSGQAGEQAFGPVTKLPMPRYVSIKAAEANARRGPSTEHRIDWVFQRRHLPVQITAEYGHWRRIRDQDGASGWVHYALLSGARFVTVTEDQAALRRGPADSAEVLARAELGVVARLGKCVPAWCEVKAGGYRGWIAKGEIWGVGAGEIRD